MPSQYIPAGTAKVMAIAETIATPRQSFPVPISHDSAIRAGRTRTAIPIAVLLAEVTTMAPPSSSAAVIRTGAGVGDHARGQRPHGRGQTADQAEDGGRPAQRGVACHHGDDEQAQNGGEFGPENRAPGGTDRFADIQSEQDDPGDGGRCDDRATNGTPPPHGQRERRQRRQRHLPQDALAGLRWSHHGSHRQGCRQRRDRGPEGQGAGDQRQRMGQGARDRVPQSRHDGET